MSQRKKGNLVDGSKCRQLRVWVSRQHCGNSAVRLERVPLAHVAVPRYTMGYIMCRDLAQPCNS